MNRKEYEEAFGSLSPEDKCKALNIALEIRKFEIEHYWKRATYFWAFIATALAGYVTVLASRDIPPSQKADALLAASCLGVVFSVAWYFVNRASKFWQENWEKHVDLLEDTVIGPLYKTVLSDDSLRFWRPWGPYPFSVSKLNQILSFFVMVLFLMLTGATLSEYSSFGLRPDAFAVLMITLTVVTIVILVWCGRTRRPDQASCVSATKRRTEIV
jgi:uncharacterized membrane protein YedE/YeeE